MSKILGKLMSLTWNGSPVDIQSQNFSEEYNVLDVTDSGTSGDSTETITGRATRTLQIEGVLKNGGTAQPGKDIKLTHNAIDYPATSVSYEESWDEIDVTDGATPNEGTEAVAGFANRTSSVDIWMKDNVQPPAMKTAQSATLLFATGLTAAGSFRPESRSYQGSVRDAQKVTIGGTWQGAVTETGLGLTGGEEQSCVLTYKDGTGSDEAITGNAIIMSKSISADINGEIRFSYTMRFNSFSETNYSAI